MKTFIEKCIKRRKYYPKDDNVYIKRARIVSMLNGHLYYSEED